MNLMRILLFKIPNKFKIECYYFLLMYVIYKNTECLQYLDIPKHRISENEILYLKLLNTFKINICIQNIFFLFKIYNNTI
jgi:hypothetical protein